MKNSRKLIMTLSGTLMTETNAREYYGDRYDTSTIAKVIVNEDGIVIGSWE
jgi:hypothetical protein